MARPCATVFVVFLIGVQGSRAFSWTSPQEFINGSVYYACSGDSVSFNWSFVSNSSYETIINKEWYFSRSGMGNNTLIATQVAENFLVVQSKPHPLIEQIDVAGIRLENVTSSDKGVYSVHVNVIPSSGSTTVQRQDVLLVVSEGPRTDSGFFNVSLLPEVVYSPETWDYHAQLTCGNFDTLGSPPVSVEWTTPSGRVYSSTFSTASNFTLAIPNPVEGGIYTCRLNSSLTSEACAQNHTLLTEQASYHVDAYETRLFIMEYRLTQLEAALAEAQRKNANLTACVERLSNGMSSGAGAGGPHTSSS